MNRIALTDGPDNYFDRDKAQEFDESTWWNGRNIVSCATGSDREHERLYRTQGGRWILGHWLQFQDVPETYEEIDNAEAAAWLVKNKHEPHAACAEEFSALEIA